MRSERCGAVSVSLACSIVIADSVRPLTEIVSAIVVEYQSVPLGRHAHARSYEAGDSFNVSISDAAFELVSELVDSSLAATAEAPLAQLAVGGELMPCC